MRHFPIFMDLDRRPVLVVGTGESARRKAELLQRAGADVRRTERFAPEGLIGCALAVAAGADDADLRPLAAACRAANIPLNVVDRPELCTFIMPALIDRDPITIAVGSSGTAPVLARLIRSKIEALVPPAYGKLASLVDEFTAALRRRLPDLARRRRFLEAALTGPVAELVLAGRSDEARAVFANAVEAAEAPRDGMVFLVGAGPGAADLLTLRAQRLLGEADVIVHDRLVTDDVLDMARRDADRIYVGKARANHCMRQDQINALLVRLAREGRKVVRLKGGDPLVFGRGGEEAETLEAEGVRYEIVPGVTAALACAAQARIPLTHREAARGVTFVTGHTKDGRPELDYAALARSRDTLAIYMGVVSLPLVVEGLLAHGMDPAMPAAVVERGGTSDQRDLRATVGDIVARLEGWAAGGPTMILIGAAVGRAAANAARSSRDEDAGLVGHPSTVD